MNGKKSVSEFINILGASKLPRWNPFHDYNGAFLEYSKADELIGNDVGL